MHVVQNCDFLTVRLASVPIAKVVFLVMVPKNYIVFFKNISSPRLNNILLVNSNSFENNWFFIFYLFFTFIEAQKIPALRLRNHCRPFKWWLKILFEINYNSHKQMKKCKNPSDFSLCRILLNDPSVYVVKVVFWQIVRPSLLAT